MLTVSLQTEVFRVQSQVAMEIRPRLCTRQSFFPIWGAVPWHFPSLDLWQLPNMWGSTLPALSLVSVPDEKGTRWSKSHSLSIHLGDSMVPQACIELEMSGWYGLSTVTP